MKKRIETRILTLFLAVVIFFTMQGVFIRAEEAVSVKGASSANPANPKHYCDPSDAEKDRSTWNCVYFGSYPQSEVEGKALTTAITGADYDANGDAWVNGTRYRRISKKDTVYQGHFGKDLYRYFIWEPVKWKVLRNNGKTLFLMAAYGLDCRHYHDAGGSITWENCALRRWLNQDFYETAFTESEQDAIVEQVLKNEDNSDWGISGGNDTGDKVYLISEREATTSKYGFCQDDFFSPSRQMLESDYAYAKGAIRNDLVVDNRNNCRYWLRSPGKHEGTVTIVSDDGRLVPNFAANQSGKKMSENDGVACVVPALHVRLSANVWSKASDEPVSATSVQIKLPSKQLAAGIKVKVIPEIFPKNAGNQGVFLGVQDSKGKYLDETYKNGKPVRPYASFDSVNPSGVLTLKKSAAGKTITIVAQAKGIKGKKGVCKAKVKIMEAAVKQIKLSAPKKTIKTGKTIKLKASVKTKGRGKANKKLKWSCSNAQYATVDKNGKVRAKKAGAGQTVTITATSTDGTDKKADIKIKIE